jgi:hypothetical protein
MKRCIAPSLLAGSGGFPSAYRRDQSNQTIYWEGPHLHGIGQEFRQPLQCVPVERICRYEKDMAAGIRGELRRGASA